MNKIYNKDAFELLTEIQKGSVDLVILDPNYQDWDNLLDRGLLELALDCIKESGNVICFTKQPFYKWGGLGI